MTGAAVAHGGASTPDGVLVQEAAAGSGVSYGTLYDRYATQVFNYCLRLTGSPEDASDATQEAFVNVLRRLQEDDRPVLEFSSYLFAAARNEAYSLMRQRARQHPSESPPEEVGRVADVETDPERAALLRDTQEAVQKANAKLAPRHREALALRELAGRSYDEVGEIMGISSNAAAQLIWRARSKLRVALTAGAVASVVPASEDCEWAQLLLSKIQDDEPVDEADREWLDAHLEECGSCQTANRMLLEAGASYRMWVPVALLAGMRTDTLTAAGGVIGADWSGVAATGQAAGSSTSGTAGAAAVAGTVVVAAGIAFLTLTGGDKAEKVSAPAERPAVEAPAPAESTPARPDRAKAAARTAELVEAQAPRAAPAAAKPPASGLQPTPPQAPPDPQPRRPDAAPVPPPDAGPPQPKADPPPPPAAPAPQVAPPPQPQADCNWAGGGNGPTGCPPGQGGLPPGQGGTPPGLPPGGPPGLSGGGPPARA